MNSFSAKTALLGFLTVGVFFTAVCFYGLNNVANSPDAQNLTSEKGGAEVGASLEKDLESEKAAEDTDLFSPDRTIEETRKMDLSADRAWWVNSGGELVTEGGVARTISGDLPAESFWRTVYGKNNPEDTDSGKHPQNIFRLVAKNEWKNLRQESYFRVTADNLSASPHRNDSNGLLLFNRYKDGDNLYYTGVRVDGFAVIKKKIKGKYFTLAYNQVFPGAYDHENNPNLIPHDAWVGVRSEVNDLPDGQVSIRVFMDQGRTGDWQLVAEAVDDGKSYGGAAITDAGHAGIRTDFMDVEFTGYRIEETE